MTDPLRDEPAPEAEPADDLHVEPAAMEAPAPPPELAADPAAELTTRMRSGATWFFIIVGLSIVNTILIHAGVDRNFIVGLGFTLIVDHGARELSAGADGTVALVIQAVAIGLDVVVLAILVGLGLLARRGHAWAFIVGMALYALDSLIYVLVQEWLSVAFHLFVLFCLWSGLKACLDLKKLPPPLEVPAPSDFAHP